MPSRNLAELSASATHFPSDLGGPGACRLAQDGLRPEDRCQEESQGDKNVRPGSQSAPKGLGSHLPQVYGEALQEMPGSSKTEIREEKQSQSPATLSPGCSSVPSAKLTPMAPAPPPGSSHSPHLPSVETALGHADGAVCTYKETLAGSSDQGVMRTSSPS